MAVEPGKMLDKRMIRVWRIHETLSLAALVAVCAATYGIVLAASDGAFFENRVASLWLYLGMGLVLAVQLGCLLIVPGVRYSRWRYEVNNTDVLVRSGLFIVKTSVIPMVRVQHVETVRGPIISHYGLASVTVTTAGSSFEIPGLDATEAENLRDRVAVLARIAQEDV